MSQARITLRPPPNVEFVEGYPGIPAGPERPHAEVRGTIELRLPAQGTKAKWVRVELKKVETLPGGGQNNTFYDFVGQSPLKVWESSGQEWALLNTQDFPFGIRIPESVPPTISLDKGAGIKYELTATICTKGKSKFFFKKKDAILATTHPIVIDKHELHSTWPVYAQPDSRHILEDMLVMTVERSHTCYGPGDRVKVVVSFKNDGIPAASLRAFEFLLKETIIYRAGPQMSGKKAAPHVQVSPIGEQKIPVNMTIYQGQSHRAELGCFIPQTHTNTSVSSARHLDISYSINVKAVLATGKPLLMELPVTVSNWPRNMSIEAVRRIGPSPALSLAPPVGNNLQRLGPMANTIGVTRSNGPTQQPVQQPAFNTAPPRSAMLTTANLAQANERNNFVPSQTASSFGDPITGPRPGYDEFGTAGSSSGDLIRRPQQVNTNPSRRLTLVNAETEPEPDSPPTVQAPSPKKFMSAYDEKKMMRDAINGSSTSGSSSNEAPSNVPAAGQTSGRRAPWPSAEEEKQRLYNNAKQQAQRTQAIMGGIMSSIPESQTSSPPSPPSVPDSEPASPPKAPKGTPWPTAEEEKLRLFNAAQDAARRTQAQGMAENLGGGSGMGSDSPPATQTRFNERPTSGHGSSHNPGGSAHPTGIGGDNKSAGAQLYQHAMASINRTPSGQSSVRQTPQTKSPKPASSNNFRSAEEEKAALRYYEAKRAVDRHQQQGDIEMVNGQATSPAEGPIAYEDLYPSGPSQGASSGRSRTLSYDNMPPPITAAPLQSPAFNNALSEKERLRLKYEAEDAAASGSSANPPSPPARAVASRANPPGYGPSPPPSRSQPVPPPADFGGQRMLSAQEEKARLKAQMEAEEAMANGSGPHAPSPSRAPSAQASLSRAASSSYSRPAAVPPPPPLAPRPPVEYIQQTREEDVRSQAEHGLVPSSSSPSANANANVNGNAEGSRLEFGLPFRPFSPLDLGINFDNINKTPVIRPGSIPPPPPLPPKVSAHH